MSSTPTADEWWQFGAKLGKKTHNDRRSGIRQLRYWVNEEVRHSVGRVSRLVPCASPLLTLGEASAKGEGSAEPVNVEVEIL
ncbi:MAG: hypothetical protein V7K54_22115 [Nostoc sp.]